MVAQLAELRVECDALKIEMSQAGDGETGGAALVRFDYKNVQNTYS